MQLPSSPDITALLRNSFFREAVCLSFLSDQAYQLISFRLFGYYVQLEATKPTLDQTSEPCCSIQIHSIWHGILVWVNLCFRGLSLEEILSFPVLRAQRLG